MKKFLLFILFAAFSLSISASGAVVIDGTATVKMEIKNPIEAEKTAEKESTAGRRRLGEDLCPRRGHGPCPSVEKDREKQEK